jgi:hypothetical protein
MEPSIIIAPSVTATVSEAVTLIGCTPVTVEPDRGLTIEVVGAVVSVSGVGEGVGEGVGGAVGLGVGAVGVGGTVGLGVGAVGVGDRVGFGVGAVGVGAEGADAVLPDCAASSASKSTPMSVPSEALPLYGLSDESL